MCESSDKEGKELLLRVAEQYKNGEISEGEVAVINAKAFRGELSDEDVPDEPAHGRMTEHDHEDQDGFGTTDESAKPDNETAARQAADDLERCGNCGQMPEECKCDEMPALKDENDEVADKVEKDNANQEGDAKIDEHQEHSEIMQEIMGAQEDMPLDNTDPEETSERREDHPGSSNQPQKSLFLLPTAF